MTTSLSRLPLPSIAFVLTSSLLYIPSVNCEQELFPPALTESTDFGHSTSTNADEDEELEALKYQRFAYVVSGSPDVRIFDSSKKRKQWLHILRRRRDSSISFLHDHASPSFLTSALRKILAARSAAVPFSRNPTQN
ncbi:hypothetical protein BDN70DRAFT_876531 [Pholiota conissans]|uniref:Uncharacterized protein n=1 Tax=Pholiota conissans TaxID=109636 RepID=A0A9P5Z656_9AGAR|nr:hypothetical protein BDN70DRAFT_876531 [Pholiota conissans]